MNHIEVLMEYKYMQKSLTQALTTLSTKLQQPDNLRFSQYSTRIYCTGGSKMIPVRVWLENSLHQQKAHAEWFSQLNKLK